MLTSNVCLIVFIFNNLYLINSQWNSYDSPPLPVANDRMAIGLYENSIFIVGGFWDFTALVEYNITSDEFKYDQNFLSNDAYGSGQYWSQVSDKLFLLNPNRASLMVFDLSTKALDPTWSITEPLPENVGISGCITATNEMLYFIGGFKCCNPSERLKTLYMLSLDDPQWINGPLTTVERSDSSCILSSSIPDSNQKLYVIGDSNTNTVEYVSLYRILFDNNQWQFTNNNLTEPLSQTRAVLFNDIIYVIGGCCTDSGNVYLIDINTNTISVSQHTLAVPVWGAAVILVDNMIYAFGGRNTSSQLNIWQTYKIPTIAPSTAPTNNPSIYPSDMPSVASMAPTYNPFSPHPTERPSSYPTKTPWSQLTTMQVLNKSVSTTAQIQSPMNESLSFLEIILVAIGVLLILVVVLLGWLIYYVRKKPRNKCNLDQTNTEATEEALNATEQMLSMNNTTSQQNVIPEGAQQSNVTPGADVQEKEMVVIEHKPDRKQQDLSSSSSEELYGAVDTTLGRRTSMCGDCGMTKEGKPDPNADGKFYCDDCWASYEEGVV